MTSVLLFARARELAGTKTIVLGGSTVAAVLDSAAETFGPEFAQLCETCTIVVDDEIVRRDEFATRGPGSELAILPPVSGGSGHDHDAPANLRVAVLTVSDRASVGEYDDRTGPALEAALADHLEVAVVDRAVVPDEFDRIVDVVTAWCDGGRVDLVVTNGGTGLAVRDVTPEAVRSVLDVEAPGIPELMRSAGLAHTPFAALSRQVAGRRGSTIVVSVPGSVKGAVESIEAVAGVLGHAVSTARGGTIR